MTNFQGNTLSGLFSICHRSLVISSGAGMETLELPRSEREAASPSLEGPFQDSFVALENFQIRLAVASRNDMSVRFLRRVPVRSDKKGRRSRRRTIDPGGAMKVYARGFRSYG